ncbi:MAG: T9SS type A sorting domain-containing protein [Bacteroidaceae bacterium]|nr:T9SS type A sorting domain-containing protein [Bacteroidaceae bacterium]
MKTKNFLTSIICCVSICANAQVIVNNNGNVTLGATTTTRLTINETLNNPGLFIQSNGLEGTNGSDVEKSSITVYPDFTSIATSLCGITAWSSPSSDYCYGIGGISYNPLSPIPLSRAGVYGSSSVVEDMVAGTYAGYFNGDVRVTGTMYGTLLTPSGTSSSNSGMLQTETVRTFSANETEEESVSDKLQQVQLLQLYRSPEANKFTAEQIQAQKDFLRESMATGEKAIDIDAIKIPEEKPQTQLSTVKYGLAADQLKEVYPELVYEDENGNVSINYIEMIPLLVQALNELNAKVVQLESGAKSEAKTRSEATAINTVDEAVLSLAQNNPNPFSESTSIEVSVPQSVRSANLFIYDMSGKMLKRITITGRGTSRVPVTAEGLTEGMYLYTLVADGKVAGTKKMILAK